MAFDLSLDLGLVGAGLWAWALWARACGRGLGLVGAGLWAWAWALWARACGRGLVGVGVGVGLGLDLWAWAWTLALCSASSGRLSECELKLSYEPMALGNSINEYFLVFLRSSFIAPLNGSFQCIAFAQVKNAFSFFVGMSNRKCGSAFAKISLGFRVQFLPAASHCEWTFLL